MELLILLLERRGALVSRDEIVKRLWGPDLYVEAESGINTAIRKLRQALQDSPEKPSYVETVAGKGYRFIGAVPKGQLVNVAVLPVVSFDPDPDRQYLADGMTEEVIAAIGQADPERLRVIGRTSMMAYKGTTKPLSEIGAALGAEFLVESSMRSDRSAYRITSRLIRASDQVQLWCESFDNDWGSSVLELQKQLSLAIAKHVSLHLSSERLSAIGTRHPKNHNAYDLYLRGRFLWHRLSGETTRGAIEHYRRAVSLDKDYGLAWAGLAIAFAASPITGDVPAMQVWPAARHAAAEALRSAPDLAESHTAHATVQFWLEWNLPAAAEAFRHALRLDSSDPLAHRTLGIVLAYLGRGQEAQASAEKACQLDPLNAAHFALASQVAFFGRDYRSSLDFAKQAVALDQEFWVGYLQLAQAAERLGEVDVALGALNKAAVFSAENSKVLALRGYLLAQCGRESEAGEILKLLHAKSLRGFVPPYAEALVHAGLNHSEPAIACLHRAFDLHDVHLNFLMVDSKWDSLREDPRVQALIARCGFLGELANQPKP